MAQDPESVSIYDWAVTANLQPEPISVEVWRNLPEEFCRQVELVNGQVVRRETPSRAHQAAATHIMAMLDAAAEAHMERSPGTFLDTNSDFDVLLWEVPAATIRSPDAALFDCAPNDLRPLPASHLKVVVEVVSPGSRKADKLDKMAESPSESKSTGTASPTWFASSLPCQVESSQRSAVDPGAPAVPYGVRWSP